MLASRGRCEEKHFAALWEKIEEFRSICTWDIFREGELVALVLSSCQARGVNYTTSNCFLLLLPDVSGASERRIGPENVLMWDRSSAPFGLAWKRRGLRGVGEHFRN